MSWGLARAGVVADGPLRILSEAVFRIDAADPGADSQKAQNLGTGGSALDARYGSTTGADTNDPKLLTYPDAASPTGRYVYLPGVAGNYMSVPDEAALDITGDIDIRVKVALDDWTPASNTSLLEKAAAGQRSYAMGVSTGGPLLFRMSTDGTADALSVSSSVATGIADGSTKWVRVTRSSSTGDVKFYLSDDNITYTQLGTTVTTTPSAIYAGTASVQIGAGYYYAAAAGKFYRAQILNGIAGTTVLDVDTSVVTSGSATSFTATTGQTCTIARAASGRKSVAVVTPVWLFGLDDYFTQASALTGASGYAVGRRSWSGSTPTVAVDFTQTTIQRLLAQDGANYLNSEVLFAAALSRTLTAAEQATLSNYLTGRLT